MSVRRAGRQTQNGHGGPPTHHLRPAFRLGRRPARIGGRARAASSSSSRGPTSSSSTATCWSLSSLRCARPSTPRGRSSRSSTATSAASTTSSATTTTTSSPWPATSGASATSLGAPGAAAVPRRARRAPAARAVPRRRARQLLSAVRARRYAAHARPLRRPPPGHLGCAPDGSPGLAADGLGAQQGAPLGRRLRGSDRAAVRAHVRDREPLVGTPRPAPARALARQRRADRACAAARLAAAAHGERLADRARRGGDADGLPQPRRGARHGRLRPYARPARRRRDSGRAPSPLQLRVLGLGPPAARRSRLPRVWLARNRAARHRRRARAARAARRLRRARPRAHARDRAPRAPAAAAFARSSSPSGAEPGRKKRERCDADACMGTPHTGAARVTALHADGLLRRRRAPGDRPGRRPSARSRTSSSRSDATSPSTACAKRRGASRRPSPSCSRTSRSR